LKEVPTPSPLDGHPIAAIGGETTAQRRSDRTRANPGASFAEQPRAIPTKEAKMLVLSRKKNESIVINNDITIVVVEIRGDKVRLGVEAPKEVPVHRREVYDAIRRNDSAAAEARAASTNPDGNSPGSDNS
jgi:carbon storage regulator